LGRAGYLPYQVGAGLEQLIGLLARARSVL